VRALASRLRGRGVVAVLCALLAAGAASAVAAGSSRVSTPRVALLLGDSLTSESMPVFVAPSGWHLEFDAWPGMAPCDWMIGFHPNFLDDIKQRPAVVMIETAGNDATKCMRVDGRLPAVGSPAYLARYKNALSTIFAIAHNYGVPVILIAPPPMLVPHVDVALKSVLAWAHAIKHVHTSWLPRESVALFGAFTEALPCMGTETASLGCERGWILVRTLNTKYHVHFCPYVEEFTLRFTCAVYSSGETRWTRAVMRLLSHWS